LPKEALKEAIKHKEEITPKLLEMLDSIKNIKAKEADTEMNHTVDTKISIETLVKMSLGEQPRMGEIKKSDERFGKINDGVGLSGRQLC